MRGTLLGLAMASLVFLYSPDASAQYRGGGDVTHRYAGSAVGTLSVGPAMIDAAYAPIDTTRRFSEYDDIGGLGVRLGSRSASLTLAYGSTDGVGEVVSASASFGPLITPYARRDQTWVGVHIPVRLGIGYSLLNRASIEGQPDEGVAHIGVGGIGLGLAVDGGVEIQNAFASEVSALISFIVTPGVMTDFSRDPFDEVYAQRSSELNAEVRASRVAGSGVGLTLGYTWEDTRWSSVALESASGVSDAISASDFVRGRRIGLLRFGLSF